MRIISHRGNLNGIDRALENHPRHIAGLINQPEMAIDVEVDLWYWNDKFYLGHDEPQNFIKQQWIEDHKYNLWIHCKNSEALAMMLNHKDVNCFWHQQDDYTITSKNWVWCYPDKQPPGHENSFPWIERHYLLSVGVLPELNNTNIDNFTTICTDQWIHYNDQINPVRP